jgi:hypothetical protein
VVKRYLVPFVVMLAVASGTGYGQVPDDVAKASAELAARQAEAIARAQQRVAQEAEAARKKAQAQQVERDMEEMRRRRLLIPLDVLVTLSRFQGDKKVSSLPYQLAVNAVHREADLGDVTNLRMGAKVPLPTMATPTVDGKPVTGMLQANPIQYNDIGTAIDAWARFLDDGVFDVGVSVEDTSVYTPPNPQGPIDSLPVIRTFRSSNHMMLKDGQTKQFTLAADRVSGETLRVDVTLKVAK